MKYLKHFIFVVTVLHVSAQKTADSMLHFSQEKWEKVRGETDYNENYLSQESDEPGRIAAPDLDLAEYRYLFYILALLIVVVVIMKVLRDRKANAEVKNIPVAYDPLQEIGDKIHEVDLDKLLDEALQRGEFRLALRLHFLIIIKLLAQRGMITWAKEKTNWEYHAQLKDKSLADPFREIVRAFEMYWYGDHEITEEKYRRNEPALTALAGRLKGA